MYSKTKSLAENVSDIKHALNSTSVGILKQKPQKKARTLDTEVSSLVDQHEDILSHLNRQVNCYKDSLEALRGRCEVLVAQNKSLHTELEQHINLDINELVNQIGSANVEEGFSQRGSMNSDLLQQMLGIREVYEQQITTLERQVKLLKKELDESEQNMSQIRNRKVPSPTICTKCSSNTSSDVEMSIVKRLEGEKDELEGTLLQLQSMLELMRRREDEALGKVKKSVQMVDKAKFDQENLEMRLKRSQGDLCKLKERHSVQVTQAVSEQQGVMEEQLQVIREEMRAKDQRNVETVSELQRLQVKLDELERDRVEMRNTIERYREQGITSMDVVDRTSQQLRDQLRATLVERDEAISAVAVNKNNVQIELHDRQREVVLVQNELARVKERQKLAEEQVHKLVAETTTLNDEVASLKIDINRVQNEKMSMEKTTTLTIEHLKLISSQTSDHSKAEQEEMRSRHSDTILQLHTLLQQQQNLANKWRNAHSLATKQFEETANSLAQSNAALKKDNSSLKQSNENQDSKIKTLSGKAKSLKEKEKKMSKSMKLAEEHIVKTAEELYSVVQKKNALLRERQVMCKEITMLQSQVCETPLYVPNNLDIVIPEHDVVY